MTFLHARSLMATLAVGTVAAVLAAAPLAAHAVTHTVGGKVVSVSHQKVTLANKSVADKISVTVDSCAAPGTLTTLTYNPSTVSDRATLGFLFEANLQQARNAYMLQPQPQINGFGLFWADDNNVIQRSGFLSHDVGCGQLNDFIGQFQ